MQARSLPVVLLLINVAAGCGGAENGGGKTGQTVDTPLWTADSVGFLLQQTTSGAPSTYYRTMAPSPAQLEALSRLRLVPSKVHCYADGWHGLLIIYDRGGAGRPFLWEYEETSCQSQPLLEDAGYRALVAAVPGCNPGDFTNGCRSRVPLGQPTSIPVAVQTGETWLFSLTLCSEDFFETTVTPRTQLRLRAAGHAPPLAMGGPVGDACAQVTYRFESSGTYQLEWDPVGGYGLLGAERVTGP